VTVNTDRYYNCYINKDVSRKDCNRPMLKLQSSHRHTQWASGGTVPHILNLSTG